MKGLSEEIHGFAREQGADLYGVAPAETYPDYREEVRRRLSQTETTHVDFMIAAEDKAHFERISDPARTLPTVRAVVIMGVYAYDTDAVGPRRQDTPRGMIARTYAYYPVVRRISEAVADFLHKQGYGAIHGQDVPLKYVADRIGLGCYGKNGVLLTEKLGSYVALRSVVTDAPLEPTRGAGRRLCGGCTRCVKACPTGALYAPYKVNPRLCINPLTRRVDPIAPEVRPRLRNWVRGCDVCQEVCPVNQRLTPRQPDPRACFDPTHHSSHQGLGGLERFPELTELLAPEHPDVVRRAAAIAMANAAKDDEEAVTALREQLGTCNNDLQTYFRWAINALSRREA